MIMYVFPGFGGNRRSESVIRAAGARPRTDNQGVPEGGGASKATPGAGR